MKTKNIHFRIDEELKNRIDRIVEREHINLSAVVRDFLAKWADKMEGVKQKTKKEELQMKKWFIDDVFVRNGKVYDRGYYIREDGVVEWTEPVPNGRTHEFPISECYHPAGPLSIEPGDPISIEDGELLGSYMEMVVDGIVIRDRGNVVLVYGDWQKWYDKEMDGLLDTAPIRYINGTLLEITDEYVEIEKDDDFEMQILDGLGNIQEIVR